ncbi:hypothetical protein LCGC14_2958800, partial [marine sediment metagenome]
MPTGDALLRAFTQSGAAFAPGQIAGQQAGSTIRNVLSTLASIPEAKRQKKLDEARTRFIGAQTSEAEERTRLMQPTFESQQGLQEAYATHARALAERQRFGVQVDFLEALPSAIAIYETQPELGSEIINNLTKARGLKTKMDPELFRSIGPAFGEATNEMFQALPQTDFSDAKAVDKLLTDTLIAYGTHPSLANVSAEKRVEGAQKIVTMYKEIHALRNSFSTDVGKMNDDQFFAHLALKKFPNSPDEARDYFIGAKSAALLPAITRFMNSKGLQVDAEAFKNYKPPTITSTIDSTGKTTYTIKREPAIPKPKQQDELAELDFNIVKNKRLLTLFNTGAKDWVGPTLA